MAPKRSRKLTFTPCCNPFGGRHQIGKVFPVTNAIIEHAKNRNIHIALGQFICNPCRNRLKKKIKTSTQSSGQQAVASSSNQPEWIEMEIEPDMANILDATIGAETSSESKEETDSDDQFEPTNVDVEKLRNATNNLLALLGIGAIDKNKMRARNFQIDVMKKLTNRLTRVLFPHAQPANDAEQMIMQLKEKFHDTNSRSLKTKILSVLPKNWSVEKIRKAFDEKISVRLIKQTKKLVKKNGILCDTTKKMASHHIDQKVIDKAIDYYRSDGVSRPCPGIREHVRLKTDGGYEKVQRRLIMMNLEEVYQVFKQENPGLKIGFSKFASIRPKECVLAGSTHGIHTTCVCVKHQNAKLIFDSLKSQYKEELKEKSIETYRDLMNTMLCKEITENCRLNKCSDCPGIDGNDEGVGLRSNLFQIIDDTLIEKISIKQWTSFGSESHNR